MVHTDLVVNRFNDTMAIIIRHTYDTPGVSFFTEPHNQTQVGILIHKAGHKIPAHYHPLRNRSITGTQEVLVIQEGKVRATFYDADIIVGVRILEADDVLILMSGGHAFEVLEDCRIAEVKQGPYDATKDKILIE